MLQHYLKIAFRNLWKYKTQTLISIAGLAVGFVCFSLAAMWIRYEKSYDNFHPDNDRIYLIRNIPTDPNEAGFWKNMVPYALPFYLEKNCPEVELTTSFFYQNETLPVEVTMGGISFTNIRVTVDSSFIKMFDIKTVSGNIQNLFRDKKSVALTEKAAKKMFGNTSPIGQTIHFFDSDYTIVAVVKNFAGQSNFPFDILAGNHVEREEQWTQSGEVTFIKLHKNVNIEAFTGKIVDIKHSVSWKAPSGEVFDINFNYNFEIIPVASVREKSPFTDPEVKRYHIYLFAISGALLIICCLFNYLTLFLSRFRMRRREFAIRMVNGSSLASLFNLLFVEFVFVLIISYTIGLFLTDTILFPFQKLSQIDMGLLDIYKETLLYTAGIILFSILLFAATLFFFRKDAISASARKTNNRLYRKASIVIQLVISIGFIFCTSIMVRQLWYLHNTDIGFEYANVGSIFMYNAPEPHEWESQIRKIPGITNAVAGTRSIFPSSGNKTEVEREGKEEPISIENYTTYMDKAFFDIYKFKVIKGEILRDDVDLGDCLITETAARVLGIDSINVYVNGVGEVKGIIADIYNSLPTVPPQPIVLYFFPIRETKELLFSYEGDWKTVKNNIEQWLEKDYPGKEYSLTNCREKYNDFFRAEEALLTILGFISIVCIVISLFGFVSLISLNCEERRKEIAIRKVNGATVKDILFIFLKEYALLLLTSAIIAFPIAYYIMKGWLEQYTNQTSIDAWIYVAILLSLALVIVLCVGWRVYKTSKENPADVVKSE